MLKTGVAVMLAAIVAACSSDKDANPVDRFRPYGLASASPHNITRLDCKIRDYITLDSAHRADMIRTQYRQLHGFGLIYGDSVENRSLAMWSTWPATTAFMPHVEKIYTDIAAEEAALGKILTVANRNGLDVPANDYATVTWGLKQSMAFVDSVMYIALNHYLGPLNEAYTGMPDYIRRLKTRDMIPVDMAEALVATAYPYRPIGDKTVLSYLLYNGALAVAKQAMVPDAPLCSVLGFTPQQLNDIQQHERLMWQRLVIENRLYSTDAALIHDLFSLQPSTTTISPDCPGRAVRYIGYRIVTDYLKNNPSATLKQILSPAFYSDGQNVLRQSSYAG